MRVYKVYGNKHNRVVYINNKKVSIDKVENSIFCDYVSDYGYGQDNLLVVIEDDSERVFLNGSSLADKIEPTRVSYYFYKCLDRLSGSGMLHASDYDAETKTIMIYKNIA